MIPRSLTNKIKKYIKIFPVVTVTGPRQSGKTTLLRYLLPEWSYVSLEDPDTLAFCEEDPRGFLETNKSPLIIDEAQKSPKLFSYIQTKTDKLNKAGQYLLSGSQNFLLLEKISQSLSGRAGILTLMPFAFEELKTAGLALSKPELYMFNGFYPAVWSKKIKPSDYYPNYIQTYLERDVRQIVNVNNLFLFQKFLKLCAGRSGQLLNLVSLASDCGVTHNTARSWLSVLEASHIIFLLPPYFRNINKRLIKSPKLYFWDTGLASYLLGIENEKQMETHPLAGSLFETMIISEIFKGFFNKGIRPNVYFFRDKTGHEVDLIIEKGASLKAIEIKFGKTINANFFDQLFYWQKALKAEKTDLNLIYAGETSEKRTKVQVLSWKIKLPEP